MIDDAAALRAGGTASVLGCTVKAPSTLGVFLRSFSWGHVRPRPRQPLLARGWAAGAGPGAAPFTIDLDSTLCETYGLAKEGAPQHALSDGYHSLPRLAAPLQDRDAHVKLRAGKERLFGARLGGWYISGAISSLRNVFRVVHPFGSSQHSNSGDQEIVRSYWLARVRQNLSPRRLYDLLKSNHVPARCGAPSMARQERPSGCSRSLVNYRPSRPGADGS